MFVKLFKEKAKKVKRQEAKKQEKKSIHQMSFDEIMKRGIRVKPSKK